MESIFIECNDGYKLAAQFFNRVGENKKPYPVLICSATGLKKGFYKFFASWLSEQGYDVLTFDYRGIGESLYVPLKKSKVRYTDWGTQDIPSAMRYLLNRTESEKVILLGHSVGGQLLGIVPDIHKLVVKAVIISSSTSYIWGLSPKAKALAFCMFNFAFPICAAVNGYCPTKMVGFGQNLPKYVGLEWAEFAKTKDYLKKAIGSSVFKDHHNDIKFPIINFFAKDDYIVSENTVNLLMELFPNSDKKIVELNPKDHGCDNIKHSLMFRKSHSKLWSVFELEMAV